MENREMASRQIAAALSVKALLATLFCSSIFAADPSSTAPDVKVDRLQACHLAEIHTGAACESVALETQRDAPVYVVQTRRGDEQHRVVLSAVHGRLLSISRKSGQDWEPAYRWPGIRVVAHRGGALLGPPENTIPAIEKAIEVGADLIEIDIRQTSDGHLVLMHDATVNRTTNGSGPVSAMTLDEVLAPRSETTRATT